MARTQAASEKHPPRIRGIACKGGARDTRMMRPRGTRVLTPSCQCAQEIFVVHEHVQLAEKAQMKKTLMIIPFGTGAIQIEKGVGIPEDRVNRQEENVCGYVAVATRLEPEVTDVSYGQAQYRPEEGREPQTQFYYTTRVSQEAFDRIMSTGAPTKEGAPGWSKVERGVIPGTEDPWVVVHGTMCQVFQDAATKKEVLKDRQMSAIVIDAEVWQEHPMLASRLWKPPDPREVPFTAFVHDTLAVQMEVIPFQKVLRQRFCQSLGARMIPAPCVGGWTLEKEEIRRAVRSVRIPGMENRTMNVGWKMPGKLMWRGDLEEVEEAKKVLFLPSKAIVWKVVSMVGVEVPNPDPVDGAAQGEQPQMVKRFKAVGAEEVEVDVFWGMPGAPVILPAQTAVTEGASQERKAWEASPMRMLAVGGLEGALAHAKEATKQKSHQQKTGREKLAALKPVQEDLAKKITPLLMESMERLLAASFPTQQRQPCESTLARLGRSISRMDPPLELTLEALQPYMPVPDPVDPMRPMYVPEVMAKQACFTPRDGGECCKKEVCWSVSQRKLANAQLWPPVQLPDQQQPPGPQLPPPPLQQQLPGQQPPPLPLQQQPPGQLPPPPPLPQQLPHMMRQGSLQLGTLGQPQQTPPLMQGFSYGPGMFRESPPKRTHSDSARQQGMLSKRRMLAGWPTREQGGQAQVQNALMDLHGSFMDSGNPKDQRPGVLFEAALFRIDLSRRASEVIRAMHGLVDGYERRTDVEGGWRKPCGIEALVAHIHTVVQGVTMEDIAEAITVCDQEHIIRLCSSEEEIELQHCMRPRELGRDTWDPYGQGRYAAGPPGGFRGGEGYRGPGSNSGNNDQGSRYRPLEGMQ